MSPAPIHKGFTLIEMLMALAVLSIVLAIGYGSLSNLLQQQLKLTANHQQITDLRLMTQLISTDFAFANRRSIRNEYGNRLAAFSGNLAGLSLSTSGRRMMPGLRQSRLHYIEYEFENNSLSRYVSDQLDGFRKAEQSLSIHLRDIDDLKWQFLSATGVWENSWPAAAEYSNEGLPVAVKLQMTVPRLGFIEQLFLIP